MAVTGWSFSSSQLTGMCTSVICGLYRAVPCVGINGEFVQTPACSTPTRTWEYAETSSIQMRTSLPVTSS